MNKQFVIIPGHLFTRKVRNPMVRRSLTYAFTLVIFCCLSVAHVSQINAQGSVYGDSDSFAGIEEQARRRAKEAAEAALANSTPERNFQAEAARLTQEHQAQWQQMYSAYRPLIDTHLRYFDASGHQPLYLRRQQLDAMKQSLAHFKAEEQAMLENYNARVQYAHYNALVEHFNNLQTAGYYDAAQRTSQNLEVYRNNYNATLQRLQTARTRAAEANQRQQASQAAWRQNLDSWKNSNVSSYSNYGNYGGNSGSTDSSETSSDLDSFRDAIRNLGYNSLMNSAHGH